MIWFIDTVLDRLGLTQMRKKGAAVMNAKICGSGERVGGVGSVLRCILEKI